MLSHIEKKYLELASARSFLRYTLDQLKQHGNTEHMRAAMDECLKEMPTFGSMPVSSDFKNRYTSILPLIGTPGYSVHTVTVYMQTEVALLHKDMLKLLEL